MVEKYLNDTIKTTNDINIVFLSKLILNNMDKDISVVYQFTEDMENKSYYNSFIKHVRTMLLG